MNRNSALLALLLLFSGPLFADTAENDSTTTLDEVVVEAQSPAITYQGTNVIVDVAKDHMLEERNAYSMLKLLPYILTDEKGNISVKGQSAAVMINGRKVNLSGSQLQAYLENIQGNQVNKIVIETMGSASRDADGPPCVIRFDTRKKIRHGYLGRVGANYARDSKNSFGEFASFSFYTKKVTGYANLSVSQNNNKFKYTESEINDEYSFETKTSSPADKNYAFTPTVGFDFDINPKHYIGIEWNAYFMNRRPKTAVSTTETLYHNDSLSSSSILYTNSPANNRRNTACVYYNWTIDTTSNFKVAADYTNGSFCSNTDSRNVFVASPDSTLYIWQPTDTKSNLFSAQADYEKSFGDCWSLKAGIKYACIDVSFLQSYSTGAVENSGMSDNIRYNDFRYGEQRGAAYAEGEFENGSWGATVGIRTEFTRTDTDQRTMADGKKHSNDLRFFPNIQAIKYFGENLIGLVYETAIERPSYGLLNPYVEYISDISRKSGNPDLKPTLSQAIGMVSQFKKGYSVTIAYDKTTDIAAASYYVGEDGLSYSTYGNIATRRSVGVNAFIPIKVGIWTSNNNAALEWAKNSEKGKTISCWTTYSLNSTNILRWSRWFNSVVTLTYFPRSKENYRIFSSEFRVNLEIGYTLLKGRLNLRGGVNDLLNASGSRYQTYRKGDIVHTSKSQNVSRKFFLSVAYSFSHGLRKKMHDKVLSGEEDRNRM